MKHAVIDISNQVHRAKHVVKTYDSFDECVGLILSNVFMSIRKAHEKFKANHCVVCFDSYSWRRDIYPEYKANRRDEEPTEQKIEEHKIIKEVIANLKDFFDNYTNVTVLCGYGMEADDFIARWVQLHDDPMFQHVIISSDSDLKQLVSSNVELFDPIQNTLYTSYGVFVQDGKRVHKTDGVIELYDEVWKIKVNKKTGEPEVLEPQWNLFMKCIRGDSGDNITTAYPRVLEKKLRQAYENKGGYEWNNIINAEWGPEENRQSVKERYERNRKLIDLTMQPVEIKNEMDRIIGEAIEPKNKILIGAYFAKYCQRYRLNRLQTQANIITQILANPY